MRMKPVVAVVGLLVLGCGEEGVVPAAQEAVSVQRHATSAILAGTHGPSRADSVAKLVPFLPTLEKECGGERAAGAILGAVVGYFLTGGIIGTGLGGAAGAAMGGESCGLLEDVRAKAMHDALGGK